MTNAIIIHGAHGNPEENWFPWLKKELEKREFSVYIPELPTPENQNLEAWEEAFKQYNKYLTHDSVIIGHSIGVAFALRILERLNIKIKGAFLVAGFINPVGVGEEIEKLNSTFLKEEFDFTSIKKHAEEFFIYASDNDPYVTLEETRLLADKFEEDPIIIEGAGHFNKESGYETFEDILIDIISVEHKI